MTATVSLTICQYCEHANPADAKFCAGCGAPLHLVPCPTCGAVNQKTSKTCYQCHGQLHESTEILLAHEPVAAPEEATRVQAVAAPYPYIQAPTRQRPSILVVAIILAAFIAAAYFAYRQRGVVGAGSNSVETTESSPANLSAGAINKAAPAPLAPKAVEPVTAVPEVAGKNGASEPAAPVTTTQQGKADVAPAVAAAVRPPPETVRTTASRRRASVEPPVSQDAALPATGTRAGATTGIEKQPPKIGPCTEAVAALGLCTPGPTKGKE